MKKRKSAAKKQIQRIKARRSAFHNRKETHPILKPGMLLKFRKNPIDSLTEDEWVIDPGIGLLPGETTTEQLEYFYESRRRTDDFYVRAQNVYGYDLHGTYAFLLNVCRLPHGHYYFRVLVENKFWWIHQSDFEL